MSLSERQINREVVNNVLNLTGVDISMKCDILLQSIKDLATTFTILKSFYEVGRISEEEYAEFLKNFVNKLKSARRMVDLDPRKMSSVNY